MKTAIRRADRPARPSRPRTSSPEEKLLSEFWKMGRQVARCQDRRDKKLAEISAETIRLNRCIARWRELLATMKAEHPEMYARLGELSRESESHIAPNHPIHQG